MRMAGFAARNIKPITFVQAEELSDVVVIAGPNGVGKTRLIQQLLAFCQNPRPDPNISMKFQATCDSEVKAWGKQEIDTAKEEDVNLLQKTLKKNRRRRNWKSNVLYFESDRTIQKISPYNFNWDTNDPFIEEISWNLGFNTLRSRFDDTIHSIFRKVRSRKDAIAEKALNAIAKAEECRGQTEDKKIISLEYGEFPDPLEPFKEAFIQLLSPKTLLDANPKDQQLKYSLGDKDFPITTLSSGEQEVVNIVFDFLLRNPSDCAVFFDEPELHLHPELSYKLIQTLRTSGIRNQFVLCTHSADIITASLENSVIFIAPPKEPPVNQAVIVREDDKTHHALRLLGQSIGIISLGRKIVLIEGASTSLDKQTYGMILKNRFSDLVLVPSGGKVRIRSFNMLHENVLNKSLWGIEFFMLCDRDAMPPSATDRNLEFESHGRLHTLRRYHLENYFLNENCIANIFQELESSDSPLRSPELIKKKLKEIASNFLPYAVALITSANFRERAGNIDTMPDGCHDATLDNIAGKIQEQARSERHRIENALDYDEIRNFSAEISRKFVESLENDTSYWKFNIPGKPILSQFCNYAKIDTGRFKLAYINSATGMNPSPFAEIIEIFSKFDQFRHR